MINSNTPLSNPILSIGTQQALANLDLDADVENIANNMTQPQLQQIMNTGQSFQDQFAAAQQPSYGFMMPMAAQMPFNSMSPNTAFSMNQPMMNSTYGSGGPMQGLGMGPMLEQMQAQSPMNQQYMQQQQALQQQALLQQPMPQFGGVGQGMPGGPMGGLAGLNNGMPGTQSSNVPGAGGLTAQQMNTENEAQLKTQMDNWNEAVQLASSIESAEHNVRMSIIQNIR